LSYPAGIPLEIHGVTFLKLFDRKIFNSLTYWNFI
jgi:hypothetical protein